MGTLQKMARDKSANARKPSNQPNATTNRAGGVAFEITDSSTKLVTMTGGAFFAEPKFYNAESCRANRVAKGKLADLARRLDIVDSKLNGFVSCEELDEVAREVVATAIDVANSENPEDLLVIANWLRHEMNIRLTPQVLLVLASRMDSTKSLVRKYAPEIILRPDEVKTVWLVHRFFFGHASLSNGLARGVTDAISKFGERGLMKYDSPHFPKWFDILQVTHKRKKDYPLPDAVAKYFIAGETSDATPIISARKELAKKKHFDGETKELARASLVNWEVLLSQFPEDKKAVWEFLIDEKLLGYMAMRSNLRNVLEARVSKGHIEKVSGFISSRDAVLRSKQLPFRFLAARRYMAQAEKPDMASLNELAAAVELASNYACESVDLPGTTVIFADNSRSMMTNNISGKSKMNCADAANILCGIVGKGAEVPYVVAFGSEPAPVHYTKNETVLGIAEKVARADTKGHHTNAHLCVEWMIAEGLTPDRVIVLSDMQTWSSNSCNRDRKCVADVWPKYQRTSAKAKETWLHCVHMNGYGDSMVDEGDRVNQLGAFSEKVFEMMRIAEGLEVEAISTVGQIRKGWTVT